MEDGQPGKPQTSKSNKHYRQEMTWILGIQDPNGSNSNKKLQTMTEKLYKKFKRKTYKKLSRNVQTTKMELQEDEE